MAIISVIDGGGGFFSIFFFVLNHFLYSKKIKENFYIESSEWIFKYNENFGDYFLNKYEYNEKYSHEKITYAQHGSVFGDFTLDEYREAIKELYVYNKKIINIINAKRTELHLTDKKYDSIFVRRGDKLISESVLINTKTYVDLLLKKNPKCNTIFVQTDDYDVYLDVCRIVKGLNIRVLTLCRKDDRGMIIFDKYKRKIKTRLRNNNSEDEYFNYNKMMQQSIETYNKEQMYDHVVTMITGIDIVINSNLCVLDYQSGVSRFIKLAHNDFNNVISVENCHELELHGKYRCPAYTFEKIKILNN